MASLKIWALIPARGGSKSVPLKNLALLGGRPLIDYGILAAQKSARFDRIICSTEDDRIAKHVLSLGVEVDRRPDHLAQDDSAVADVGRDFISRQGAPDILALIQPVCPFLLPEHIHQLLDALIQDVNAHSAQTVAIVPHNHHSLNQRVFDKDGYLRFRFPEERAEAYNKQRKPKHYVFGNLVAIRPKALEAKLGFFAEPSIGVEIPQPYDFDVDNALDFKVAEALLSAGVVQLP